MSPEGWDCRHVPPGPAFSFFAALRNSAGWCSALVSLIVLQSLYRHSALCWEALCLNASLWSHKSKKGGLCSFPAQVIQLMFVNWVSERQIPGLHRLGCYHSIYLQILSSGWGPLWHPRSMSQLFSPAEGTPQWDLEQTSIVSPSPLDFTLCVLIEVCGSKLILIWGFWVILGVTGIPRDASEWHIRSLISTGRRNQGWCWGRTQQLNYAVESSRVRFKFHCYFSSFPAASVQRSAAAWSDHAKGFRSQRKALVSDVSWSSTKYTGFARVWLHDFTPLS